MEVKKLKSLIEKGENAKVDFKREWYWNNKTPKHQKSKNKEEFVKDIVALTNGDKFTASETAYLIIGITDDTKEVYDFDKSALESLEKMKQELFNFINNYAQPRIIDLNLEWVNIENTRVLVISVLPQDSVISLVKNINKYHQGTTLFRIGEDVKVPTADEIIQLQEAKKSYSKTKKLQEMREQKNEYESERTIKEELYKRSEGRVSVIASLPVFNHWEKTFSISCEISFKLGKDEDLLVSVQEYEVLEYLFSGYKSDSYQKNRSRKWILYYDIKHNLYGVNIGSLSLSLSYMMVQNLSQILDDLHEVYVNQVNILEAKLQSKQFPFSTKHKNGFELCRVSYELWLDIQEFALNHNQIDNEGEVWNIFGDSIYEIDIYNEDNTNNLDTRLTYILDETHSSYRDILKLQVVVVWDSFSVSYVDGNNIFKSVNESNDWLTKKLIPKIIKNKFLKIENKKESFIQKIISCLTTHKEMKQNSMSNTYRKVDYLKYDYEEEKKLLSLSDELAHYLHTNKLAITDKILIDLYEGLILLFENSQRLNYSYLYKKFRHIGHGKDEKFDDEKKYTVQTDYFVQKIKDEINIVKTSGLSIEELLGYHTLEHIFKCYFFIVRDNIDSYREIFMYEVYSKLVDIEKIYNIVKVRERMLTRF